MSDVKDRTMRDVLNEVTKRRFAHLYPGDDWDEDDEGLKLEKLNTLEQVSHICELFCDEIVKMDPTGDGAIYDLFRDFKKEIVLLGDPIEMIPRTDEEMAEGDLPPFYFKVKEEFKDRCICDWESPLGHILCAVCNGH